MIIIIIINSLELIKFYEYYCNNTDPYLALPTVILAVPDVSIPSLVINVVDMILALQV
jgi:hypothetical protein